MAKKFLEEMDEVFGGDILADVIPFKKKNSPAQPVNKPQRSATRKKSFLSNIESGSTATSKSPRPRSKKSFLDAIEAALEDEAFDDIIPIPKSQSPTPPIGKEDMKRLSMAVPASTMSRLKSLAKEKNIGLNDLIRAAIEHYMMSK